MTDPEKFEGAPNNESISGNEGLPQGARKFKDEETAMLLQEMWNKEIEFYRQFQININESMGGDERSIPGLEGYVTEISGINSQIFNGVLHPKVERNSWFRGIAIQTDPQNSSNQILIFTGWMQLDTEDCAPLPIAYTVGNVPSQTVRKIVQSHTKGMSDYINSLRTTYPNQNKK